MQRLKRVGLLMVPSALYVIGLLLAPDRLLFQAMVGGVVPILLASWLFGAFGAVAGSAVVAIINGSLLVVHNIPFATAVEAGAPFGMVAALGVGMLVGMLKRLSDQVRRERAQLLQTQEVTIFALAYQAELRDFATGRHLERTAAYVELLAEQLRLMDRYREYMSDAYVQDLVRAAPLHDIGKVGIPDAVLLKTGKLSAAEFEMMERHCELGTRVLRRAEQRLTFRSFLTIAIQITQSHHEKWNGTGYPEGRRGEDIPLSARIMALGDVYDALRTERPYKAAFPHERAIGRILLERGSHFDPDIVDCFVAVEDKFAGVADELADPEAEGSLTLIAAS